MSAKDEATRMISIHSCDAFRVWLGDMLVSNPNGMGSELVTSLPGVDNSARADALLRAAEELGWIERTAFAPSDEQEFFGVGGSASINSKSTQEFHPQLHMFRILDREAVASHVGDKMPKKAAFRPGDVVKYRAAFIRQIALPSAKKDRFTVAKCETCKLDQLHSGSCGVSKVAIDVPHAAARDKRGYEDIPDEVRLKMKMHIAVSNVELVK